MQYAFAANKLMYNLHKYSCKYVRKKILKETSVFKRLSLEEVHTFIDVLLMDMSNTISEAG